MKTLKYIVSYRMGNDAPQEEREFFTKQAAEAFALGIYLSGGVSVTTEDLDDDNMENENGIY